MKKVIKILEDVKIDQNDEVVILEKGDKIQVLSTELTQEEVHLNPVNIQKAVDAYHKAVSAGEDKVVDWALEKLKVEVTDDIWNLNSKDFNLLWDNLVKYKFL